MASLSIMLSFEHNGIPLATLEAHKVRIYSLEAGFLMILSRKMNHFDE